MKILSILRKYRISIINFNNFDSLLARMSCHHEMANLTTEKCQKSGKKYGVVCCFCCYMFVAFLLKNPLQDPSLNRIVEFFCWRPYFELDRLFSTKNCELLTNKTASFEFKAIFISFPLICAVSYILPILICLSRT